MICPTQHFHSLCQTAPYHHIHISQDHSLPFNPPPYFVLHGTQPWNSFQHVAERRLTITHNGHLLHTRSRVPHCLLLVR